MNDLKRGLASNADDSMDLYVRPTVPKDFETNTSRNDPRGAGHALVTFSCCFPASTFR